MKKLGKLKLFIAASFLLFGMSSCLKSSDPHFSIIVNYAYILQEGYGDHSSFLPIAQIQSNQPIDEVYGTSPVCTFEGKKFIMEPVKGYENFVFQTSPNNMGTDTVTSWACEIKAVSRSEKPETAQQFFNYREKKELGKFEILTPLTYNGKTGEITCKWKAAKNAENYTLVMLKTPSVIWSALNNFTVDKKGATVEEGDELTGKVTLPTMEDGAKLMIGIAAHNGTFWNIQGKTYIEVGKSNNVE